VAYEENYVEGFGERVTPVGLTSGRYPDHFARYLFAAHFVAGCSVADLCCGVGYGSNLLLAAGAVRVKGFDLDGEAISTAKSRYAGPDFCVAAADRPLDLREFDVRVCFEGIEHVTDPDNLLANMRGADLAFISSPNASFYEGGFSGNPHHLREWTRTEFEAMLARHFSEVRMYFQWHSRDPLDQDWNIRAAAKALLPVSLKARMRPPPAEDPNAAKQRHVPKDYRRASYRVHPATYLSVLPPGLRYATPTDWLAVCRG
jgi:SAM-dependent methyltransferase